MFIFTLISIWRFWVRGWWILKGSLQIIQKIGLLKTLNNWHRQGNDRTIVYIEWSPLIHN
jgi:hypothetical protein